MQQNCSPICLEFPEKTTAVMKEYVNDLVGTKFNRAGLGNVSDKSTLLILDTPMFRTTRMLFSRFAHGIKRLIIVEINPGKAEYMRNILLTSEFRDRPIEIVTGEVIDYLQSSTEKIDFIWLDLQSDRFTLAGQIKYHLTNAQCFAVTIAMRSRKYGTVASRVDTLTGSVKRMMPHLVVDFGYRLNQDLNQDDDILRRGSRVIHKGRKSGKRKKEKHSNMHLLVYSKHWSPCDYHLGRDGQGHMFIYGYPMTRRNYQPKVVLSRWEVRKSPRLIGSDQRSERSSRRRRVQF